ncbi:hypothetical protein [Shewanella marisflavi]|uniref:hypothetical protein n=1 Tax=Shewanella marisflavi TaxID=260364 RepID=UPI003AAB322E
MMIRLSFTEIYCRLLIILLPFWTLPIIPGSFKPITVFLVFPLAVLFLLKRLFTEAIVKKDEIIVLAFLIFGAVYSLILFIFEGGGGNFIAGFIVFLLGVSSYFGYKYIISKIGLECVLKYLKYSIVIVVFIGWIDFLGWIGFIPTSFRVFVNEIVAGKSGSRIILTTSEAAWASRLVLCLLPFALFDWFVSKRKSSLFLILSLVMFFVFAFSLSGFVVLTFVLLLYLLSKFSIKSIIRALAALIIGLTLFYSTFSYLKSSGGGYFVSRIEKVATMDDFSGLMNLDNLASFDGSAFIRLGYPIISIKVFLDNPWGIGVGRYGLFFNEYISNYGKSVQTNIQVIEHVSNSNADQRSYYTKVLTEHGVLLSVILFLFYFNCHKRLNYCLNTSSSKGQVWNSTLRISLFVVYANMIQFGSYLFPFYWLIPALIYTYYEKK